MFYCIKADCFRDMKVGLAGNDMQLFYSATWWHRQLTLL